MGKYGHHSKYRYTSYVYAVRRANGDIKIGYTWNLDNRLAGIRSKHGEVEVLGVIPGGRELEKELHQRFDATRHSIINKRGQIMRLEWFSPSLELDRFINQRMERFEPYAEQMRRMGYEGAARNAEKARGRQAAHAATARPSATANESATSAEEQAA